jgi:hypothetical protein
MVPSVISPLSIDAPKSFARFSVTVPPRLTVPPPVRPVPAVTVSDEVASLTFVIAPSATSAVAIVPSTISAESMEVPSDEDITLLPSMAMPVPALYVVLASSPQAQTPPVRLTIFPSIQLRAARESVSSI